jgi:hypothetical protein
MATIESAKAKFAAKIPSMRANFVTSMSKFAGHDVSNTYGARNYQAAVTQESVEKWERGVRAAWS